MFWIPICAIMLAVWLVKKALDGVNAIGANKRAAAYATVRQDFESRTRLSREAEYEITKRLDHNFDEQYRVVREFMGSDIEERDVRAFTLSVLRPAYRILAMQRGCRWPVWELDVDLPSQCSDMDPPWKIYELAERLFLKLEDEMNKHGVQTKIMADYLENHFEPVRDHVARCGYGKLNGRVKLKWIQYTSQWESIT